MKDGLVQMLSCSLPNVWVYPKAIYDNDVLIGFASYGFRNETKQYELISMMLGHQYQG